MHASVLCKCLILLACVGATTPFQAVHVALQPGASCTHHAAGWRARAVSGRSARASPRALAATAATTAATTAASQSLRAPPCPKDARVLVVFTGAGDLRLHDHGGLAAAAAASEIHCMAVLDPVLLARVPNRRIRALVSAVRGVGSSLAELGINLDVRMGAARQVSAAAATEAQATHVYLHSDPESSAQQMLQDVAAGVTDARPRAETHLWNAALRQGPLQEREDFESYQASLGKASARLNSADRSRDLLAQRAATAAPPFELPPDLLDKLLAEVEKVRGGERARAFALRELSGGNLGDREETSEALALDLWERYKTLGEKAFAHSELVPALSSPSLEHISARVYGPDGYAHGEAFLRVFSEALALGCLSPRKVMQESNDALWSEGVVPFILANQGRRALHMARSAVEAREWHRVLAVRDTIFDPSRTDADSFTYHYWRWKGFLVRYLHSPMQAQGDRDVGGVERSGRTGRDRPALVLVHGFGASADQWHRLIAELGGEYDVWALDLLGFGHSEKPTLSYTQFLWEDVVRDFVLECVQRPCVLGGNSIGGYTALCAAGALRPNVEKVCKAVYPDHPDAVDARLVGNIVRDSKDPGGYSVVAAGAKLPTPITKNELLHEFAKPVLVAQGLNDPLGGGIARTRYNLYKEAHPDASKVHLAPLEAGHCPHHEVPEAVASEVKTFMAQFS